MHKFKETHTRSIVKVVTWRVLLTISHVVNAFIITGSWITGLQIAGLAAVINSILFWSHERGWNILQWNRQGIESKIFIEGQSRTLAKIITWRILITSSNFIIPFIMTSSWGSAALFVGLATVFNICIFWAHERLWNIIRWGKYDITA